MNSLPPVWIPDEVKTYSAEEFYSLWNQPTRSWQEFVHDGDFKDRMYEERRIWKIKTSEGEELEDPYKKAYRVNLYKFDKTRIQYEMEGRPRPNSHQELDNDELYWSLRASMDEDESLCFFHPRDTFEGPDGHVWQCRLHWSALFYAKGILRGDKEQAKALVWKHKIKTSLVPHLDLDPDFHTAFAKVYEIVPTTNDEIKQYIKKNFTLDPEIISHIPEYIQKNLTLDLQLKVKVQGKHGNWELDLTFETWLPFNGRPNRCQTLCVLHWEKITDKEFWREFVRRNSSGESIPSDKLINLNMDKDGMKSVELYVDGSPEVGVGLNVPTLVTMNVKKRKRFLRMYKSLPSALLLTDSIQTCDKYQVTAMTKGYNVTFCAPHWTIYGGESSDEEEAEQDDAVGVGAVQASEYTELPGGVILYTPVVGGTTAPPEPAVAETPTKDRMPIAGLDLIICSGGKDKTKHGKIGVVRDYSDGQKLLFCDVVDPDKDFVKTGETFKQSTKQTKKKIKFANPVVMALWGARNIPNAEPEPPMLNPEPELKPEPEIVIQLPGSSIFIV